MEVESEQTIVRQMDNIPDGNSDVEEEGLDPRIQSELDHLNVASAEINRLENELDEARSKYRSIISETSNRMEVILHDRKRSIQKSREYYKLLGEAKIAQAEALKAARQFQTATTIYKAAKETVALAECRLIEETKETTTAAQLTSAWQEMLNHAISKVTLAERDKTKSEQEHKKRAAKFAELESRIQVLEKKFSRSIKKSRPFFELKAELDIKLMQQKQNVNDLQAAIKSNKRKYNETLRQLEKISEEIHQSRHEKFWSKVPRMPGVGAETDSVGSSLSELGKESMGYESDLESQQDTESLRSDLDLQLTLEVGGQALKLGLDKTPVNEEDLDKTLVDQDNDVFEPGTVPNVSTTLAENDKVKPVVVDNVSTVTDKVKLVVVDNVSTTGPESSGCSSTTVKGAEDMPKAGTETGRSSGNNVVSTTSTDGAANTVLSETKPVQSNDKHINDQEDTINTTGCAVAWSETAEETIIDSTVTRHQGTGTDSDDEFTESFESCHEEQQESPAEDAESRQSNVPSNDTLVKEHHGDESDDVFQVKGVQDSVDESVDIKQDMAKVERPSLSGAED